MSIIDDLKQAVEVYETESCVTEIVDYSITPGGGTILNTGETFKFRVRVRNQGNLDMKNVKVRVKGTSYADVASQYTIGPIGSFGSYIYSAAFNLDAHQNYTTGYFTGKAKQRTNGAKDIVIAKISQWNAAFGHILHDHTGAGAYEGRLNKDIKGN